METLLYNPVEPQSNLVLPGGPLVLLGLTDAVLNVCGSSREHVFVHMSWSARNEVPAQAMFQFHSAPSGTIVTAAEDFPWKNVGLRIEIQCPFDQVLAVSAFSSALSLHGLDSDQTLSLRSCRLNMTSCAGKLTLHGRSMRGASVVDYEIGRASLVQLDSQAEPASLLLNLGSWSNSRAPLTVGGGAHNRAVWVRGAGNDLPVTYSSS